MFTPPSPPSSKGTRVAKVWAYEGSMAVNAVLILAILTIWWGHWRQSSAVTPTSSANESPSPNSGRVAKGRPASDHFDTNNRRKIWASLVSTNFALFGENLRRVGAPDQAVCDILRPAIQRWSSAQLLALSRAKAQSPTNYWATGQRRRALLAEETRRRLEVRKSVEELLRELSCASTSELQTFDWEQLVVCGFLGRERTMAVAKLIHQGQEESEFWQAAGWGGRQPTGSQAPAEMLKQIRQAAERFDASLMQLMSTNELQELLLRSYRMEHEQSASTNQPVLSSSILPSEFRQLTQLEMNAESFGMGDLNPLRSLLDEVHFDPDRGANHSEVAALLGTQRAAEYIRNNDGRYVTAREMLISSGFSPEIANRGYDLVQNTISLIPDLRAQASTNLTAARMKASELRQSLQQQLSDTFSGLPEPQRSALAKEWTDGSIRAAWNKP